MFCTQCGTATAGDARFCSNCGKPAQGASSSSVLASNPVSAAPPIPREEAKERKSSGDGTTAIPNHILESLKKFEDHKTVTCLECGYAGMMGIKKNIVPWYVSWWAIAVVIVVFGAGFVFGLVLGLLRLAFVKQLVICPSCNSELITK